MQSSAVVRRSSCLASRRHFLSVVSPFVSDRLEESRRNESHRHLHGGRRLLSSSSPPGGGRGGRGPSRGEGALNLFRQRRAAEKKKQNYAKTVLEPAARGELQKGHSSGIPKLLGRKRKSQNVHDVLTEKEATHLKEYMTVEGEEDEEDLPELPLMMRQQQQVTTSSSSMDDLQEEEEEEEEEEYDSEDEYDEMEGMTLEQLEQHPLVTKNADGTYSLEYDSDWGEEDSDDEDPQYEEASGYAQSREDSPFDVDPETAFFYKDIMDASDPFPEIPDEQANRPLPLADHGENLDDFLEAMIEHPTKYAEVKRYNPHPESKREAQVEFPSDRHNPELAFVKKFKRFAYVSNLPHAMIDEEAGDFDNPLHRHEVIKMVTQLLKVKPEQVSPASMTSAFVGFAQKQERNDTLARGPNPSTFNNPIVISKLDDNDIDNEFVETNPEAIVKLSNLAVGCTAEYLSRNLFPNDTEIGSLYTQLTLENIKITSPTTALIRLSSKEEAESVVESSSLLRKHLQELGETRVRCFLARRELLDSGFTGPNQAHEKFKLGPRLVVHGDVPSKEFYISHYQVVQLSQLDDKVTKEQIADFFQPYCTEPRDVEGSVEFVTCSEGLRTDRAFVGFDMMGEADAMLEALDGDTVTIGRSNVVVTKLEDRPQRRSELRETRPLRTEEELLDSLNNWEQYVSEEDLAYLEENGVHRDVLDNAFCSMRFHNKTFGPTDLAMHREKLSPELESGAIFKKTVEEYIRILKECVATPEDPGLMYKGMFLPGEEIDVSVFDREKERQEKLRKLRMKATGSSGN